MNALNRQNHIIEILKHSKEAVSGTFLSKEVQVSRQIIVKDINSLREKGHDIISTTKGYLLNKSNEYERAFKVYHSVEDTEKELNLIVDLGGEIKDVFIYHKIYGEIHAPLGIKSRKDVQSFADKIKRSNSSPLMTVTSGYHYHTIIAEDEETLDLIEKALKKNGYMARLKAYEPDPLKNN